VSDDPLVDDHGVLIGAVPSIASRVARDCPIEAGELVLVTGAVAVSRPVC